MWLHARRYPRCVSALDNRLGAGPQAAFGELESGLITVAAIVTVGGDHTRWRADFPFCSGCRRLQARPLNQRVLDESRSPPVTTTPALIGATLVR
jgi:hypothetical protein